MNLAEELRKIVKGDVCDDKETISSHSKDAGIIEVQPEVVVYPKNSEDIKALVRFVNEHKKEMPELSLTPRAAGTDMGGGPLNESIIIDFTKHMNVLKGIKGTFATVEPGMYYRDFEKETLKLGLVLPSFTASKSINAMGGMVGNNAAGELSLVYGQTQKYVEKLRIILSDGNEYELRRLNKQELEEKKKEEGLEGEIYRKMYSLLEEEYEVIQNARPKVSKNSAGYYLWNIWDKKTFDLNQVITGSQGTLGIITEITFRLVPVYKHSSLLVIFLNDMDKLSKVVETLLRHGPESLESYGKNTLNIAIRFFPGIVRRMGVKNMFSLAISLIPDAWILFKNIIFGYGYPEIIILAQFSGDNKEETLKEMEDARDALKPFNVINRSAKSKEDAEKYWTIRRESFSLLREHVQGKRTAPFIDDIIVDPMKMSEFFPRLNTILDEYPKLKFTIAGHAGDGNFHIFPLMDFSDESQRKIIPELSEKVYSLVLEYGGSIDAEHNDGLIRSPYLKKMYGEKVYYLFERTKNIFDPQNIFNPGKKVNSDLQYAISHITKSNPTK